MISVEDIDVHYGDLQVLWELSLEIREDDSIVAIVGPNGAGKTTLLKTLSGVLRPTTGSIELFGEATHDLSPSDIVQRGFVHVSEKRNLFHDLTVYENLRMGAYTQRDEFDETYEEVTDMFPVLEERRDQKAGTLSGGEQQMLAIGRGLMAHPTVLALDEPSGALAPQLAGRVFEKIDEISEDITIILIEQHVDQALDLSDRVYLLENGRIATEGTGAEMLESDHVRETYLSG
ncbi:ABC transporter ATP-binding protein [Natrinema soli]|uniref:ABC transporter ATP-binding protein n=1 Tax=Natrinema soli TaxID=1930624 RepID=A0ABD5SPW6_9EURY|nr:ABC transporter ATP-binding protein [Natrinema soli]